MMRLRNTRRQFWTFRRCQLLTRRLTKKFIKELVCLGGGFPHIWCWGSLHKLEGDLEVMFVCGHGCLLQATLHDVLLSWSLRIWCVWWRTHENKGWRLNCTEMQREIPIISRDLAATGICTFLSTQVELFLLCNPCLQSLGGKYAEETSIH